MESIVGLGITNQRETTVIWDRRTGDPIYNAIVWQDRRTAGLCQKLKEDGLESVVNEKTGLLLDPYFSATKISWLLDNIEGARIGAEAGLLAFGTIDSYLVWQLTDNHRHVTDATNASRTMLFDIHKQKWDNDLLAAFRIPHTILPDVLDSAANFGNTSRSLFDGVLQIRGLSGDQQAATIGQGCVSPGMIKCTYGTGCFALLNTGKIPVRSGTNLITTTAYRLKGKVTYALEGSIFAAGASIQWLRDGLGLITDPDETSTLAQSADPKSGVFMVPAFTGLGAPYWDSNARASIQGLTLASGRQEVVRATLEAIGFQTRDLLEAMTSDEALEINSLRVDGGLARNEWAMQFIADILSLPVDRPIVTETTALGVAYLAGLEADVYSNIGEIGENWRKGKTFTPKMSEEERETCYKGWQIAVDRVREVR